ncbi:MAG TPA: acetolactate synthase [Planctomycetaceae bacterium]|nr:acetolactate synthase [Planctomycetaceae bacterium]HRA87757.1 acetolactate synthase [Planctomycetaceae bacterium]
MSSGFGDDSLIAPMTARGRDWPCLRQFIVFLENRVGALHELLRQIERDDLRIMALNILDSADCAVVRVIVNNYERAHELLTFGNVTMFETDVIGVLLPNVAQPHTAVLGSLMSAELNVQYVYPLMYRKNGRGAVAVFVGETDSALRVLKEGQYEFVTEDDLLNYDEYF